MERREELLQHENGTFNVLLVKVRAGGPNASSKAVRCVPKRLGWMIERAMLRGAIKALTSHLFGKNELFGNDGIPKVRPAVKSAWQFPQRASSL